MNRLYLVYNLTFMNRLCLVYNLTFMNRLCLVYNLTFMNRLCLMYNLTFMNRLCLVYNLTFMNRLCFLQNLTFMNRLCLLSANVLLLANRGELYATIQHIFMVIRFTPKSTQPTIRNSQRNKEGLYTGRKSMFYRFIKISWSLYRYVITFSDGNKGTFFMKIVNSNLYQSWFYSACI